MSPFRWPRFQGIALASLVGAACSTGAGSHGSPSPDSGSNPGQSSGSSSGAGSGSSSSGSSGSSSTSGSGGDSGPAQGGGTCDGGACNAVPSGLLDPAYTTTWNPGILSDTPTGNPLGADGLPVRTTTCATIPVETGDATSAIQSALDGCAGKNEVVVLAAGTYSVSASINVPGGVVLRGAGSAATTGTVIVSTSGGPVLSIGTLQDQVCYNSSGFDSTAQPLLTQDAMKETATVAVADASNFHAGDLALLDQSDVSAVSEGDCTYFKRQAGYAVSERVEIASISGNTVTLTTPLHWTFTTAQSAQLSRVGTTPVKWAGIESVLVQGGRPGGYAGQNAGGIDISDAAYCWAKDVQVDGTTSGMPIRLAGTYRCVIRDSHFHNSYSYGFAQDNYGIVLACGSADNLVENNIARFMNKPILFNNSGGGNVIGYNYADNEWSCDGNDDDGFQEVSIDCHCAFPHMELMEGNWAPHMGATITHGNAGYLTYFRNYASSQFSPSTATQAMSAIVWSQPFAAQYANVASLDFPSPDVDMTVIGNVLGSTADTTLGLPASLGTTSTGQGSAPATTQVYTSSDGSQPAIFLVDQTAVPWTSLWLDGNFDTVNEQVMWNASALTANLAASTRQLPASLYYAKTPGWWPAGDPWPWVGPDITPKVGTLPAERQSKAFNYYTSSDAACTLDCGDYCCHVGSACSL
jgi:hypothetical protein